MATVYFLGGYRVKKNSLARISLTITVQKMINEKTNFLQFLKMCECFVIKLLLNLNKCEKTKFRSFWVQFVVVLCPKKQFKRHLISIFMNCYCIISIMMQKLNCNLHWKNEKWIEIVIKYTHLCIVKLLIELSYSGIHHL